MAVQSIRDSRRRSRRFLGVLLIALAVCGALTIIALYMLFSKQQVESDEVTLCPRGGPRGLTVILIDRTDPLTTVQREALRQEFKRIKKTLPVGTAIQVYSVGPIGDDLLTAESPIVCNPGRGEGTSKWTGNPLLLEKRWRERFAEPIERVFDQMLRPGSSPVSPILESVQSVAIKPLGSLGAEVKYRRLVIVSDMLQNTEEFSQYQQIVPFVEFKRTEYYLRVRADLAQVDVEIIYLRREEGRQGKDHIEFWQEYIADCGGRLVGVKALQG